MISPDLQRIVAEAEQRHEAHILDQLATAVGAGVRDLQGRQRTADLAKRRAVIALVLHARLGWTQRRIARALCRTTRQIKRMVRNQ